MSASWSFSSIFDLLLNYFLFGSFSQLVMGGWASERILLGTRCSESNLIGVMEIGLSLTSQPLHFIGTFSSTWSNKENLLQ